MKKLIIENKGLMLKVEEFSRTDSAMHFTWMFVIQIILLRLFGKISYVAPFLFAFGKEYYDVIIKHSRFSEVDVYYTLIGGILAIIIYKK